MTEGSSLSGDRRAKTVSQPPPRDERL